MAVIKTEFKQDRDNLQNRLKIGVIGVGMMGKRHCRIYSNLRGAQLVGVCDAHQKTGEEVAKKYDVPYYSQIDELLAEVDAVSLVIPTPLHFDLAMRCLEKGVHILIEKPITETLEQAEKLTEAATKSGLTVQVGHIERFNAAYRELKNILNDMTILDINLRRLSAYEDSNKDVDVVLDLMIHDIDLALDLMRQQPISVDAQGLTAYSEMTDHAAAHLHFEGGPLLNMTASRVTQQKIRTIEVTTLKAYIECDLLNKNISVHRRTSSRFLNYSSMGVRQESVVERIFIPTIEPLLSELEDFVKCILSGTAPQVSASDGLETLRMAALIQNRINGNLVKINVPKEESTAA